MGNHPSPLACSYLSDLSGIEIGGAAYNDFFLNTLNVDHRPDPPTADAQLRYTGRVVPVDAVAPAQELPFEDDSHDFVLASHVIEHIPDPIRALEEWDRVARRYLFLIIPSRDNPYDRDRPLTTLDELIERRARNIPPGGGELAHWSVWTPDTFVALCDYLRLPVIEVQEPDDKRGDGFAVLAGTSTGEQA